MTGFDLYLACALVAVCAASLGYTTGRVHESDHGLTRMVEHGEVIERGWQKWRHEILDRWNSERVVGQALTEERDGLIDELATKQRRVRGILAEARRDARAPTTGSGGYVMTMWAYIDQHPWWSLVFLLIVAGIASDVAERNARHK